MRSADSPASSSIPCNYLSPDKRGDASHQVVLDGPPHLGRCQPLETMSKADGMQDASHIITSVWLWRPTVRPSICVPLFTASVSPPRIAFLQDSFRQTAQQAGGFGLWPVRPRPWDGWNVMGEPTKEGRQITTTRLRLLGSISSLPCLETISLFTAIMERNTSGCSSWFV